MEAVNSVYKEVKKMFQTAVPPYVATVNDDYHYEVWAIKKQAGESQVSEELLGYVAKHEDSVTVGFNNKLGEKIRKEAFSSLLLAKMNIHGRIRIHRMTHQLHIDTECERKFNAILYRDELDLMRDYGYFTFLVCCHIVFIFLNRSFVHGKSKMDGWVWYEKYSFILSFS